MQHFIRAALVGALFGAFLGCVAYLVDRSGALSLRGWVLFMIVFVVLGGIPRWYRKTRQ